MVFTLCEHAPHFTIDFSNCMPIILRIHEIITMQPLSATTTTTAAAAAAAITNERNKCTKEWTKKMKNYEKKRKHDREENKNTRES